MNYISFQMMRVWNDIAHQTERSLLCLSHGRLAVLLNSMIDGGRHFLSCVGSNVRLINRLEMSMRRRDDVAWLWSADQRKN